MDIRQQILTKNDCFKYNKKQKVLGVLFHSTGANNPKLSRYLPDDGLIGPNRYGNHWDQPRPGKRSVCVHAFIGKDKNGDVRVYQTLPFDIEAWGSGKGSKGSANEMGYVQFEICEDDLKDPKYFADVYKAGVEFTAYLAKTYGFLVTDKTVIDHSGAYKMGIASNHGDVMHWFKLYGKSMDSVRHDVKALLSETVEPVEPPTSVKVNPLDGRLKVVYDGADGLNARKSPDFSDNVDHVVHNGEVFTVVGITEDKQFYELKSGLFMSAVDTFVEFEKAFDQYEVRINVTALHVRKEPGTNHQINAIVRKGEIFTIVDEKDGWGKLLSGVGWISLQYTDKI